MMCGSVGKPHFSCGGKPLKHCWCLTKKQGTKPHLDKLMLNRGPMCFQHFCIWNCNLIQLFGHTAVPQLAPLTPTMFRATSCPWLDPKLDFGVLNRIDHSRCTVVPRLLNRVTHLQGESVEHTHLLHLLSNVTHQSNSSKPEQGSYQARLEGYQNPSVDFFLLTRSSKPPKDWKSREN